MGKLKTILREYLNKGSEKIDVTMVLSLIDQFEKDKQLRIGVVSQQRELLLDFVSDLDDDKWFDIKMGYKENVVHEYLKSKNCV